MISVWWINVSLMIQIRICKSYLLNTLNLTFYRLKSVSNDIYFVVWWASDPPLTHSLTLNSMKLFNVSYWVSEFVSVVRSWLIASCLHDCSLVSVVTLFNIIVRSWNFDYVQCTVLSTYFSWLIWTLTRKWVKLKVKLECRLFICLKIKS